MSKKLKCLKEDQVRVVQNDNLKEFLERNFKKKYFYQSSIEVNFPKKTKLLSVFSIYENIDHIDFSNDNEEQEDYIVFFKNGNKETILTTELNNCNLIICKTLMENKDLILVDSIKLLPISVDNYFRTSIKRNLEIELPDKGCELSDKGKYKHIEYLINFIPNKIINLEDIPYTKRIRDNDQIRYKFLDGKDYSKLDSSIYESKKIRVMDRDIYNIEDYVFLKTYDNNLLMLSRNSEQN